MVYRRLHPGKTNSFSAKNSIFCKKYLPLKGDWDFLFTPTICRLRCTPQPNYEAVLKVCLQCEFRSRHPYLIRGRRGLSEQGRHIETQVMTRLVCPHPTLSQRERGLRN